MKVDAVLYFRVVDAEKAIIQVESFLPASSCRANLRKHSRGHAASLSPNVERNRRRAKLHNNLSDADRSDQAVLRDPRQEGRVTAFTGRYRDAHSAAGRERRCAHPDLGETLKLGNDTYALVHRHAVVEWQAMTISGDGGHNQDVADGGDEARFGSHGNGVAGLS